MAAKGIVIGGSVAIVLVGAALLYEVVLPNNRAKQYNKQLHASAADLDESLTKLADTTSRPLFTNPDSTSAGDLADVSVITNDMTDARHKLDSFSSTASHTTPLPLSGYFGDAKKVADTKKRAQATVDSVRKQLDSYQTLVTYADDQAKLDNQTKSLDKLGSENDPSSLAKSIKSLAATMHTAATEYGQIVPPADFADTHTKGTKAVNDMATAMDELADALTKMDLNGITTASDKLDKLSTTLESLDKQDQAKLSQNGALLKPVRQLSDAADAYKS